MLQPLVSASTLDTIEPHADQIAATPRAPASALVIGLLGALWSASGYVGAFGRAMNSDLRDRGGPAVLEAAPDACCCVTLIAIVLVAAACW